MGFNRKALLFYYWDERRVQSAGPLSIYLVTMPAPIDSNQQKFLQFTSIQRLSINGAIRQLNTSISENRRVGPSWLSPYRVIAREKLVIALTKPCSRGGTIVAKLDSATTHAHPPYYSKTLPIQLPRPIGLPSNNITTSYRMVGLPSNNITIRPLF